MSPMQIMVAVAVYNKRPPTHKLEGEWDEGVLRIMQQLWSGDPAARPSISEARKVLEKHLSQSSNVDHTELDRDSNACLQNEHAPQNKK